MFRPVALVPNQPHIATYKRNPGVRALRTKFAHIKKELRRIQRAVNPSEKAAGASFKKGEWDL